MEMRSRVHAKNLLEYGKKNTKIVVLSADLTSSCEADLFRDNIPERFISCGIAEQNMLSVAGGMAREGFIPLIHTFGVFIYRRAYDQLCMSVAYPNLNVKMFGFLPGITTPGGATHQAIEDIALMRALPNMTVLEPSDATETKDVLELACSIEGPVYIRMLRGEIPVLFPENSPMKLDSPRLLSDGTDFTLFSSGICTEEAIKAVVFLKKKGLKVCHVHVSTLKPFNSPLIASSIKKAKYGVITIENHVVNGGLGTAVAETMAAFGIQKKLVKLGLQDTFTHGASRAYLMREHSLDAFAVCSSAVSLCGASSSIKVTRELLQEVRIEKIHSEAKPEAL